MGTETFVHALEQYVQARIKYQADLDHGRTQHTDTNKKKLEKTKMRLAEAINIAINHNIEEKLKGMGYHRAES